MIKPIVSKINTFDPAFDYEFSFSYNGNQSRSNRLVITDNDTNGIVYDNTVVTMKLQQTLPANTLTSNKQYSAQFQSFDVNGEASPLSDKRYFYCLTTPEFTFTNVVSKIENSSYDFILHYSQEDSELLKEYRIVLYDSSKTNVIKDSGTLYAEKNVSDITYTISALEDNVKYYIQAFGTTVNGMEIETEKYEFYVSYVRPSTYAVFYAENDANAGCIRYSTNIVVITYNGNEVFEYMNGYINLIDKSLYYDSGFNISDDFVVKLVGTYFADGEIFKMSNNNYSITLSLIHDTDGNLRIMMKAYNSLSTCVLISDPFIYETKDHVLITFYRKDGYFGIKTDVASGNMIFADMYVGNTTPTSVTENSVYIYNETFDTQHISVDDVSITFNSVEPSNPNGLDIWIKKKEEV